MIFRQNSFFPALGLLALAGSIFPSSARAVPLAEVLTRGYDFLFRTHDDNPFRMIAVDQISEHNPGAQLEGNDLKVMVETYLRNEPPAPRPYNSLGSVPILGWLTRDSSPVLRSHLKKADRKIDQADDLEALGQIQNLLIKAKQQRDPEFRGYLLKGGMATPTRERPDYYIFREEKEPLYSRKIQIRASSGTVDQIRQDNGVSWNEQGFEFFVTPCSVELRVRVGNDCMTWNVKRQLRRQIYTQHPIHCYSTLTKPLQTISVEEEAGVGNTPLKAVQAYLSRETEPSDFELIENWEQKIALAFPASDPYPCSQ
jgi:hypothetical protein